MTSHTPFSNFNEEDDGLSDFMDLQRQANASTDQSLDSTRRILNLAVETQEVGTRTVVELDKQGEQLRGIEEGMDQINEDMKDAEKHLNDMDKCCGLCILPWKRKKKAEAANTWDSQNDTQVNDLGPRVAYKNNSSGQKQSGPYVTRITNDAREDEMEDNLMAVDGILGNLKNMAVDMGNTIEEQNTQVDRISDKAGNTNIRVREANKHINQIIRKN